MTCEETKTVAANKPVGYSNWPGGECFERFDSEKDSFFNEMHRIVDRLGCFTTSEQQILLLRNQSTAF